MAAFRKQRIFERLRLAFLVVAIALCGLSGCGRTDIKPQRSTVEIFDSAGVQVVRNLDKSVDTLSVELEEVLRIGVADGAEDYQFHLITNIALDENGRFFVIDQGTQAVRVFDTAGSFVRRFGGRGKGPGEFTQISGLSLWRDTVKVGGAGAFGGALFDTTGTLLATYNALLSDRSMVMPIAGGPAGWFVTKDSLFGSGGRGQIGVARQSTWIIARIDPKDLQRALSSPAAADSATTNVVSYKGGRIFSHVGSEGGSERFLLGNPPFFEPSPSRAIDQQGFVYIARGWPYVIDVYDAAGRMVRSIRRAHDSIPVTDDLVSEILWRAKSHFDTTAERGGGSYYPYTIRAGMPRIGFVPVTSTLQVSGDGWIWLRRPDLAPDPVTLEWSRGLPPRPSHWDVFDPDGRFQYTVRLPPRFTLRAVTDSAAIGVLRDELDVEFVVRYALRRRPTN